MAYGRRAGPCSKKVTVGVASVWGKLCCLFFLRTNCVARKKEGYSRLGGVVGHNIDSALHVWQTLFLVSCGHEVGMAFPQFSPLEPLQHTNLSTP